MHEKERDRDDSNLSLVLSLSHFYAFRVWLGSLMLALLALGIRRQCRRIFAKGCSTKKRREWIVQVPRRSAQRERKQVTRRLAPRYDDDDDVTAFRNNCSYPPVCHSLTYEKIWNLCTRKISFLLFLLTSHFVSSLVTTTHSFFFTCKSFMKLYRYAAFRFSSAKRQIY